MKVKAEISIKQVDMKALMACQDIERVLGYCASCSNYGKNHSCPDFDFEIPAYLERYNYATVIMTHIKTDIIKRERQSLKDKTYESRVFTNYTKSNPHVDTDWKSQLSMYIFNTVKDQMTRRLLKVEKKYEDTISLPPGSCTECAECTKVHGKPCVQEGTLRYSLEALGFLVSDIYESFFDMQLAWTDNELPESFNTCSAILSVIPLDTETLKNGLKDIEVAL